MKFLKSFLFMQDPKPVLTNWPGDVVPWGNFDGDPLRYRFELLIEEYRQCHQDMVNLTNLQSRLENFVILLWVGLFSLIQLPGLDDTLTTIGETPGILLGISIFLSTFGFSYLMNDIKLSNLWFYLDTNLRPQFVKIVNARCTCQEQFAQDETFLLGYPRHYVNKEKGIFAPFYAILLYTFVFSLMLASQVLYLVFVFRNGMPPTLLEIALLALNIVIFVPIGIGISVVRKHYKCLH